MNPPQSAPQAPQTLSEICEKYVDPTHSAVHRERYIEEAKAAITALLLDVVGDVPADLENYGNELRGKYEERLAIRKRLEEGL
jgi:hypothetical protein